MDFPDATLPLPIVPDGIPATIPCLVACPSGGVGANNSGSPLRKSNRTLNCAGSPDQVPDAPRRPCWRSAMYFRAVDRWLVIHLPLSCSEGAAPTGLDHYARSKGSSSAGRPPSYDSDALLSLLLASSVASRHSCPLARTRPVQLVPPCFQCLFSQAEFPSRGCPARLVRWIRFSLSRLPAFQ
jgi:hypothetical protein